METSGRIPRRCCFTHSHTTTASNNSQQQQDTWDSSSWDSSSWDSLKGLSLGFSKDSFNGFLQGLFDRCFLGFSRDSSAREVAAAWADSHNARNSESRLEHVGEKERKKERKEKKRKGNRVHYVCSNKVSRWRRPRWRLPSQDSIFLIL